MEGGIWMGPRAPDSALEGSWGSSLLLLAEDSPWGTPGPTLSGIPFLPSCPPLLLPCSQSFPWRRALLQLDPAGWLPPPHQAQERAQEKKILHNCRVARTLRVGRFWDRETATCPRSSTEGEVQEPGLLPSELAHPGQAQTVLPAWLLIHLGVSQLRG